MFSQKNEPIVTLSNSERRNHPRFLAPQLSVSLLAINTKMTNDKNTISNKHNELKTLDFNYLGMSVYSQEHFNIGDALHLAITNEGNSAVEVHCFVCNRARTDLGYRSGLHFLNSESDKSGNNENSTALMAIEQSLERVNE